MAKKPVTAPVDETNTENTETVQTNSADAVNAGNATETKEAKSIVPAKYAGRYKGGGVASPLTDFILSQCAKDGKSENFEFSAFFSLCRKNGIAEDKVAHYEAQVAEKTQGANGRARMTLANMLRPIARKNQKLIGLDDVEHDVPEPKAKVTGAAAAAQTAASSAPTTEATEQAGSEAGSAEAQTE